MSRTGAVRSLTVAFTVTGLVATGATAASAAPTPLLLPHSLAVAKAAMPTARSLPGGVVLNGKVQTGLHSSSELCYGKPRDVSFEGAAAAGAYYAHPGAASPATLGLSVTVVIFKTPAIASATMAKLAKAERSCPKVSTYTGSDSTMHDARSLSTAGHNGAWSDYRTVDHLVYSDGTGTYSTRDLDTLSLRGNVIVDVEEDAPDLAGTGPHQTRVESTAVATVLTKVAALGS